MRYVKQATLKSYLPTKHKNWYGVILKELIGSAESMIQISMIKSDYEIYLSLHNVTQNCFNVV